MRFTSMMTALKCSLTVDHSAWNHVEWPTKAGKKGETSLSMKRCLFRIASDNNNHYTLRTNIITTCLFSFQSTTAFPKVIDIYLPHGISFLSEQLEFIGIWFEFVRERKWGNCNWNNNWTSFIQIEKSIKYSGNCICYELINNIPLSINYKMKTHLNTAFIAL